MTAAGAGFDVYPTWRPETCQPDNISRLLPPGKLPLEYSNWVKNAETAQLGQDVILAMHTDKGMHNNAQRSNI